MVQPLINIFGWLVIKLAFIVMLFAQSFSSLMDEFEVGELLCQYYMKGLGLSISIASQVGASYGSVLNI